MHTPSNPHSFSPLSQDIGSGLEHLVLLPTKALLSHEALTGAKALPLLEDRVVVCTFDVRLLPQGSDRGEQEGL